MSEAQGDGPYADAQARWLREGAADRLARAVVQRWGTGTEGPWCECPHDGRDDRGRYTAHDDCCPVAMLRLARRALGCDDG